MGNMGHAPASQSEGDTARGRTGAWATWAMLHGLLQRCERGMGAPPTARGQWVIWAVWA